MKRKDQIIIANVANYLLKTHPLDSRMVIQVAPRMIMINGVIVADSFKGFIKWLELHEINVVDKFKNWPFIEGLKSEIKIPVDL